MSSGKKQRWWTKERAGQKGMSQTGKQQGRGDHCTRITYTSAQCALTIEALHYFDTQCCHGKLLFVPAKLFEIRCGVHHVKVQWVPKGREQKRQRGYRKSDLKYTGVVATRDQFPSRGGGRLPPPSSLVLLPLPPFPCYH